MIRRWRTRQGAPRKLLRFGPDRPSSPGHARVPVAALAAGYLRSGPLRLDRLDGTLLALGAAALFGGGAFALAGLLLHGLLLLDLAYVPLLDLFGGLPLLDAFVRTMNECAVEGFVDQQGLGDGVDRLPVVRKELLAVVVGAAQDGHDLLFQVAGGLLTESLAARDLATQEDRSAVRAPGDVLVLAHAQVEDHLLGQVGGLLQVVGSAG